MKKNYDKNNSKMLNSELDNKLSDRKSQLDEILGKIFNHHNTTAEGPVSSKIIEQLQNRNIRGTGRCLEDYGKCSFKSHSQSYDD